MEDEENEKAAGAQEPAAPSGVENVHGEDAANVAPSDGPDNDAVEAKWTATFADLTREECSRHFPPRLSWQAFVVRCMNQDLEPDKARYAAHFQAELTEDEVRELAAIQAGLHHVSSRNEFRPFFFVRNYLGAPAVCNWDADGRLEVMTPDNFCASWPGLYDVVEVPDVKGGFKEKDVPAARHWINSHAPKYDRVAFLPGRRAADNVMNLWRGYPAGLVPGWEDTRLTGGGESEAVCDWSGRIAGYRPARAAIMDGPLDKRDPPEWSAPAPEFVNHLYSHVCGGEEEYFYFLLDWIADMLINLGPSHIVPVMLGGHGGGKGTVYEFLETLVGPAYCFGAGNPKHITGNFNAHLQNKLLIHADEAFFAKDHSHAAALKYLTGTEKIPIEAKFRDARDAPRTFRLMISTNNLHAVRAEVDDRRLFVLEVESGRFKNDEDYFGRMREEWRCGGRRDFFRWMTGAYFVERLRGKRLPKRPVTWALQRQKDLSGDPVEMAIHNMLSEGEPPCPFLREGVDDGERVFVPTKPFSKGAGLRREDYTKLGRALRTLAGCAGPGDDAQDRPMLGGERARGYWLPNLGECRRRWQAHQQRDIEWPEEVVDWSASGVRDSTEVDIC